MLLLFGSFPVYKEFALKRTACAKAITSVLLSALLLSGQPIAQAVDMPQQTSVEEMTNSSAASVDSSAADQDIQETKNTSSSAKKLKISDSSAERERWFDSQTGTTQTVLTIIAIMGVVSVLLGPLRVALYNIVKI